MHPYDDSVAYIKRVNEHEEARAWLQRTGEDYGVIHEMSHDESRDAVSECYERGAVLVEVIGTRLDDPETASADMLLITLPQEKEKRGQLFELEETIAGMSGYQLSVDEGQLHILLRWA